MAARERRGDRRAGVVDGWLVADLNALGVGEILRRVASGASNAEAVTRACLDRIAAREDAVKAWAFLDPDAALARARACDRGGAGPLRGLPIGIKDVMDTADMPTECGSPIYAGHRPAADAACVALLRAAGAIILGKTVTTEFATTFAGKTRHPLNPGRTPGGSSSGSAAAVADGMVPVALGTQTMGSVIRPAAYCGAVGFKPSFGLINRAGIKSQAESIDTIGVIGRRVEDVAPVAAVLMGAPVDAFDSTLARAPRIAIYRGPDWSKVEAPADAALEAAAQRLATAGAIVMERREAPILREALDAHLSIVVFELARALAYEWNEHRDRLSPVLAGLITAGFACSFETYQAAQRTATAARAWFDGNFGDADFWLSVSGPGEAPEGMATGDPVMNRVWSLLHGPLVSLPAGSGPNGMPLGVQLIGRRNQDAALIAAARWAQARL